jgi:hypothetical protein
MQSEENLQTMSMIMRMLSYSSLFSFPGNNNFKEEILLYTNYLVPYCVVCDWMLGEGLAITYFNHFQVLKVSIGSKHS